MILSEDNRKLIEDQIRKRFPKLPDDIIRQCIEENMNPGTASGFYAAVMEGDLIDSVYRADSKHLEHLGEIGLLFHRDSDAFSIPGDDQEITGEA